MKVDGPMLKTVVILRTKSKGHVSYLEIILLLQPMEVDLYSSMPHEDGLETLRERLAESAGPKLAANDIVKMAEFCLENTF